MPLRMRHMPFPSLRALMSLNVYPNNAAQHVHWSWTASVQYLQAAHCLNMMDWSVRVWSRQ